MQTRKQFSLINFSQTSQQEVKSIFQLAQRFERSNEVLFKGRNAALLFFEASTRTRMSFEFAAARLGMHPAVFSAGAGTSVEKGESAEDTFLNVAAMDPAVIVIRAPSPFPLDRLAKASKVPIINAGWGADSHPTQALLDCYTLLQKFNDLENLKILVVGDVRHSRVFSSHYQLSMIMGYELGVCGPSEFIEGLPQSNLKKFNTLEEGLSWCDIVMSLRVQKERHQTLYNLSQYHEDFGLKAANLNQFKNIKYFMHPGPVNYGVELAEDTKVLSHSLIMDQVRAGVYVRQALLFLTQETVNEGVRNESISSP